MQLDPTFEEQTGEDNPFDGIDVGIGSTPTFADVDGRWRFRFNYW